MVKKKQETKVLVGYKGPNLRGEKRIETSTCEVQQNLDLQMKEKAPKRRRVHDPNHAKL